MRTSIEELTAAVGTLENDAYRKLVAAADGPILDALLEGVKRDKRVLVGNKTFGKGMRGPKKLALEHRLRDVIGLARARSKVASALADAPLPLEVRGTGPGSELDLRSLAAFPALRQLDVREGGRVRGLDALVQLEKLSVWGSTIDLAEIARLEASEVVLDAPELLALDALEDGTRFEELVIVSYAPTALPPVRARVMRFLTDGGPTLGPIRGEIRELQVHGSTNIETVILGKVIGLEAIRCTTSSAFRRLEAVPPTVRAASLHGTFSKIDFLRSCRLDDLALTWTGAETLSANIKELLADHRGLRSLGLHRYNLESLLDLPPLAELETLDLSDCAGVIELGGLATRFPKLRRLVLARTTSTKDDVAAIAARGVEVVL